MDVRNCRRCKRLFNYIAGDNICPQCREELESKFQEVKTYLREHRGASIAQVVKDCDVEEVQIRKWVREERLEMTSQIEGVFCEKCGAPIVSGRFCEKCKADMINELNSVGRQPESKKDKSAPLRAHENKMRFIGSDR